MDDNATSLQRLVDSLFGTARTVTRLDAVIRAENLDLDDGAREVIDLLPPGRYTRQRLCDQVNSSLKGHGWTGRYRTVE